MKKLMMFGAMIGFVIGISFGWVREGNWAAILLKASISALAAGLLLRWWGKVWVHSLRESLEQPPVSHEPRKQSIQKS
jgi:hypothetical protein